jgi:2-polyprenyl-6-methoxyphenol hydroxylase-like FAD-dependent oxidoreductase
MDGPPPTSQIGFMFDCDIAVIGAWPSGLAFAPGGRGAPLGTLVPNHLIRRALHRSVVAAGCARIEGGVTVADFATAPGGGTLTLADGRTVRARLVVAADTRLSGARRRMGIGATVRDVRKSMLVARVAHARPHGGPPSARCGDAGRRGGWRPSGGWWPPS